MAGSTTKIRSNTPNPHERLGEYGANVVQSVTQTATAEATESGKTFLEQLLGLNIKSKDKKPAAQAEQPKAEQKVSSGIDVIDLFVFNSKPTERVHAEKAPRIEGAMNYSRDIQKSSERASRSEMNQMNQNIQEIQNELKKLVSSSKKLQLTFAEVGVESTPKEVGSYHLNFFDWMLIVIRQAREKVENSGAWLTAVKGKGSKKGLDVTNQSMHQSGERTTIQNSAG